eukprot:TRINITY_DN5482_c0_g1_i1.p1 TRINITY_DN5482_c0_g1~~TRINITY_DN5482_c0_g1_i1.p1  ORF type:complete len:177 (+),score=10.46 TRINITY_DN5482_c0_g1_i1:692-1222(+)
MFLGLCRGVLELHSQNPPIVHRDIKPMNVLVTESNELLLMDFGSAAEARISIDSYRQARAVEEDAERCCSMLYRPPEFWDVPVGLSLDERSDVWMLGCTLYEMAFGINPFTKGYTHHGASIKLSVLNGKFSIPTNSPYSPRTHELIMSMMQVNSQNRPYVDELVQRVDVAISKAET